VSIKILDTISRELNLKICFLYTFITTIPFGLIVIFAPGLFSLNSVERLWISTDSPIDIKKIYEIFPNISFS